MDSDFLKGKASELWETIVRLETEKYDLEERQRRQDYDVSKSFMKFSAYTCTALEIIILRMPCILDIHFKTVKTNAGF